MQGSSNFRNGQKQPYHKLFLVKGIHEQMIKWPLKGHYHGWSLKFLFSNFLSMLPNARINFIKRSHTGGVAKIFFFFLGGGHTLSPVSHPGYLQSPLQIDVRS